MNPHATATGRARTALVHKYPTEWQEIRAQVHGQAVTNSRRQHLANTVLRDRHPIVYRRLLNTERAALGLPPVVGR